MDKTHCYPFCKWNYLHETWYKSQSFTFDYAKGLSAESVWFNHTAEFLSPKYLPSIIPHEKRGDITLMTQYYVIGAMVKCKFGTLDSALVPSPRLFTFKDFSNQWFQACKPNHHQPLQQQQQQQPPPTAAAAKFKESQNDQIRQNGDAKKSSQERTRSTQKVGRRWRQTSNGDVKTSLHFRRNSERQSWHEFD